MGFFSLLGDIGNWFGEKIEDVGDALNLEFISDVGRGIQDIFSGNIGNEKAYDKQIGDIGSTERLNEQLVSFTQEYEKKADDLERKIIVIIEKYYDELIAKLEILSDDGEGKAQLNALKRNRGKVHRQISGTIRNSLSRRMSLDDSECLNILRMDKGSEKRNAMSAFCRKIFSEAMEELSNQVHTSVEEQREDIKEYLNDIQEKNEKEFLKLKDVFEKISKDGNSQKSEKEQYCVWPLIILDEINMIENIL